MASNKCSILVFSYNKNSDDHEDIDIKLSGSKIMANKNPVFLGIRIDCHLSFKNQVNNMKETCIKRIKVLKRF